MARSGVGYVDVAKAAEGLKARGEEPTVDKVRAQLGTGSKSTIAPLLKRWRTEVQGDPVDTAGLPRELVDALRDVYERVQAQAELEVQKVREESQYKQDNLERELALARSALSSRNQELEHLEQKLQQSQEEGGRLTQRLATALSDLEKSEFQRDEGIKRVAELKSTVEEMKSENRDIREHFEHFQQRSAEDRQQERDQARLVADQLRGQLAQLSEQCSVRDRELGNLQQQIEELRDRGRELERVNQSLVGELEASRVEAAENARLVTDLQQQLERKHSESEQAQSQLRAQEVQNAAAAREAQWQRSLADRLEEELVTLRKTVEALREENRTVLQEKAEFQGRLKQLERSQRQADTR
ncbi:DNA-binding protein [Microbulbifer elongatus]|uniref:DNA-binding protein n=1 Tax=Microbulbifer elongatus TaxID=86173 RepID=A0ABT1P3Z5_9GAMM|nr:DNA-binding protein [Microbulbifer elongatus]MCQ3830252.1 DNA-binding protein [Microbulbifer elongatus]